jgi:hypothetical protein
MFQEDCFKVISHKGLHFLVSQQNYFEAQITYLFRQKHIWVFNTFKQNKKKIWGLLIWHSEIFYNFLPTRLKMQKELTGQKNDGSKNCSIHFCSWSKLFGQLFQSTQQIENGLTCSIVWPAIFQVIVTFQQRLRNGRYTTGRNYSMWKNDDRSKLFLFNYFDQPWFSHLPCIWFKI